MKLFNSVGPNPKVVRMYMAERGIEVDLQEVDLMGGENRQSDYVKLNPGGQLPALELDNGDIIAEITCICEYLDDRDGGSSLIGTTPEERAETRMWVRRIDLGILEPLANGFRFAEGAPMFKDRMTLIPHAAADLKALAQEKITWLDGLMDGKEFVCGDRFTLADILLFVFLEFGTQVGQPLNEANKNITSLYERLGARPSAKA
ncbi:MAG: glutathione S-transferase [Gammaproteobacteria bacterium]|jgi:glutathione S-transferase|nr:glutathione S-transferase [Gammaproteobacteria bacterium]MBT3869378.1 glutathione S-transferase [Gammaproteobacteria bacterium]MBT4378455.1 glutathione S-transferase [Gammaproteobacteria bacterium]MBT4616345.1 glutathione S-transferase [Gammaproteobacteria bacterium]MBT5198477.1 glutathione S-transferase [Gammaproteobacteria bacterium]